MELRPLGSTGLRVSPIGLGLVKLGRTRGLKHPGPPHALPTDAQAIALLRAAAELGINLLDTAPAYGTSEERLGALMQANNWLGGRNRWVLSSKAGEEFDESTSQSRFDFSPNAIRASAERSLARLRTDHLDVFLLHSDGRDQWVLEESGALEALHALKKEGKVRAVGISTGPVEGGRHALAANCDVLMLTYNQREQGNGPVIDAAARAGVGVLVKKALMSGHLSDPSMVSASGDPAEASLRFALARPGVSSVIVGTTSPDHLRSAARALTPLTL